MKYIRNVLGRIRRFFSEEVTVVDQSGATANGDIVGGDKIYRK